MLRFIFIFVLICSSSLSQHRFLKKHDSNKAKSINFFPSNISLENSYVEITSNSVFRIIKSNGIPNHKVGKFPNKGNPHKIKSQKYRFHINLTPKILDHLFKIHNYSSFVENIPFGVAVNGILFDPGTAEYWNGDKKLGWNYCALGGAISLGLDECYGHVQPNGAYHYHGISNHLLNDLNVSKESHSPIVGWAADGHPIYYLYGFNDIQKTKIIKHTSSYKLREGMRPIPPEGPGGKFDGTFIQDYEFHEGEGTLDECNGKFVITPEYPNGTYAYFLTEKWPVIPRGLKGEFINLRKKTNNLR